MLKFVRTLLGIREPRTLEEELDRRFGRAMLPFVFVSFSAIYAYRLNAGDLHPGSVQQLLTLDYWAKVVAFAFANWPQVLVATAIFVWFIIYRNAVKNEIKLVGDLFSKSNVPIELSGVIDHKYLWVLQYGLITCFLLLAWSVPEIKFVCLLLLVLNMLDLRATGWARQNIERYLSDPKFAPSEIDPRKPWIEKRRRVMWHYYIERSHFERIIAMVLLNVLALLVAISEPLFGFRVWPWISHLLIVVAVFTNESWILRWRMERDASLAAIDAEEQQAMTPPASAA